MQFFQLKSKQKLTLILCIAFTVFLTSCSNSRKIISRNGHAPKTTRPNQPEVIEVEREDMPELEVVVKEEKNGKHKSVDKVISTARTFIGTPYRYGGTTRSGMDCSGLLLNSFKAVDVNLPRSSEAQSHVGKEISKMKDLEPGDLVFFATGKKRNVITHVGLVTDVRAKDNIKFIHSSSSLGVVETNLYADYYQERFRGARRVIRD